MNIPLVTSTAIEEIWKDGALWFFRIEHNKGDFLMSLGSVVESLWEVLSSPFQSYYDMLPPIEKNWWAFLGSEKIFNTFDYRDLGAVMGLIERKRGDFFIELFGWKENKNILRCTIEMETLLISLFLAVKVGALKKPKTEKDYPLANKDWFELCNHHFRLPLITQSNYSVLENQPLPKVLNASKVVHCEFLHTWDY